MTTPKRGGRRPGAGRPKGWRKANPLGGQIAVRLDATTEQAFRELCEEAEMSVSDRLRLLVEQDVLGRRLKV